MSQVLSIDLDNNQAKEALNQFLMQWESVGSSLPTEYGYDLVLNNGKKAMVLVDDGELMFQGEFGDQGLEILKNIADSFGSKLLLEGKVLDEDSIITKWNDVGVIGKSLTVLGGLVLLPFAIALLPALLVIAVIRLGIALTIRGGKHGVP